MFEQDNEQIQSDAQEASSEPTQSEETTKLGEDSSTSGQNSTEDKSLNTPFHEHPRFRELVEQKNEALSRARDLEDRYREMNARVEALSKPKTETPKDELIERLRGIDPAFADRIEAIQKQAAVAEQLQDRIQQFELTQMQTQAVSTVKSLHDQFKVPEEHRAIYNAQLELAATRNPNLTIKDIPGLYKAVHDSISKVFEASSRTQRESYVQGKKADSVPSTPAKSKAPSSDKKFEWSKDPSEARAQVVKRMSSLMKAENNV